MFVYFAHPYGYTFLEGKKIYGYLELRPSTHVSYHTWKINRKHTLIEEPFNKENLSRLFPDKDIPDVRFNYNQINHMDWDTMRLLCKTFGLVTKRDNASRRRELRNFIKENC